MRAPAWGRTGMVATSSPHAVSAALWVLDEGGTAVDAALAADAVLGLVQPQSTGIGGDGFAIVADGEELFGFNGSGAAPAALTLDMVRAPGAWTAETPLSVVVPGVVDTWVELHERFGRLPLARVLEPAIELARRGFPIGPRTASVWSAWAHRVRPGSPWPVTVRAGERFANAELASSLVAIADGGRDAHYEGGFAAAVVKALADEGGVMTLEDLAAHRGEWVAPARAPYRDHEVAELPPPGQGTAVLAALRALGDCDVAADPDDPESAAATLAAIRSGMRAAYRNVADPRFAPVPEYWLAGTDTVYTAVVAGPMAVSLITSVFMGFGSGLHAGGSALQNRGLGFRLDEAHPNALAGGKRPFHTIIPGMAHGPGRRIVFGVVGGDMQPQGHVQVLSHLIDRGLDPQAALDRPRLRWWGGERAGIEAGFADPAAVRAAIGNAGFEVEDADVDPEEAGSGQVVVVHHDGWLEGGSDPRHDGLAVGRL